MDVLANVAAVLAIAFGFSFMAPAAFGLVPVRRYGLLLPTLTTFGLSLGVLTLEMHWLAVLGPRWFHLPAILLAALGTALVALAIVRVSHLAPLPARALPGWKEGLDLPQAPFARADEEEEAPALLRWGAIGVVSIVLVAITFVGLYYPFVDPDAVANYAQVAWHILQSGGLAGWRIPGVDNYTDSYPLLVPLAYAYAYLANGSENQHLAKITPVAFAWAAAGGTYCLGKVLFRREVGLLAAVIVAATPLFGRWAPSGYVDVPLAFYFSLMVLFVCLLLREQRRRWAVLAGLFLGFCLWTKGGALVFVASLLLLAGVWKVAEMRATRASATSLGLVDLAVVLGAALVGGGFWYLRNAVLYGMLLFPIPGNWSELYSDRSPVNLLPFFKAWDSFGGPFLVPMYAFGLVYAAAQWAWLRERQAPSAATGFAAWGLLVLGYYAVSIGEPYENLRGLAQRLQTGFAWLGLVLGTALIVGNVRGSRDATKAARPPTSALVSLCFVLPFMVAWWHSFSYDARFLLAVLPGLAVLAAWWTADCFPVGSIRGLRTHVALVGLAVLLVFPSLRASRIPHAVQGWWQNPAQGDAEKRMQLQLKGAGVYFRLRQVTERDATVRVLTQDAPMLWYDHDPAFTFGYPTRLDQLDGYSYLVWDPTNPETYTRLGAFPNEVTENLANAAYFRKEFELEGYVVYRILGSSRADG